MKPFFAARGEFQEEDEKRTKQAVPAYLQPVQLRGEPRHDRVRSIHVKHCILKGVPCDGEGEANPAQEQLEQILLTGSKLVTVGYSIRLTGSELVTMGYTHASAPQRSTASFSRMKLPLDFDIFSTSCCVVRG